MSDWEKIIDDLVKNPTEKVYETDIIYKEYPEIKLKARIYRNQSESKQPMIIDIHGGAWNVGSRFGGVYYDRSLALAGFTVIAIDFRHAPEYQHPSATEDIETAIEYFKTNSDEINGDPNYLGLIGSSSGGHLALLSGISSKNKLDYVVALWPVSDPLYRYEYAKKVNRPFLIESHENFFVDKDTMLSASIPKLVRDGDYNQLPPILIVQPGEDKNVPLEMTLDLMSKYQSAGGYVEYVFYPGEEHGFAHFPSNVSDRCIELIISFAKRHSPKIL
jgi:acetyl esterase/lipase